MLEFWGLRLLRSDALEILPIFLVKEEKPENDILEEEKILKRISVCCGYIIAKEVERGGKIFKNHKISCINRSIAGGGGSKPT